MVFRSLSNSYERYEGNAKLPSVLEFPLRLTTFVATEHDTPVDVVKLILYEASWAAAVVLDIVQYLLYCHVDCQHPGWIGPLLVGIVNENSDSGTGSARCRCQETQTAAAQGELVALDSGGGDR